MNSRAACAMISTATACFHAGLWAGVVVRDVAIQDQTTSPFAMEVPYMPVQKMPVVLAQSASISAPVMPGFILNSCIETEHRPVGSTAPFGGIGPADILRQYLESVGSTVKSVDIKVTLLTPPQHGNLKTEFDSEGLLAYTYTPATGYLGDDRATFMAEYKGKHYKIVVTIKVLVGVDENDPTCPPPKLIKVNNKSVSDVSPYLLNSFTVSFGDLSGSSVGQEA